MIKLSVVIPCYNSMEIIKIVVDSTIQEIKKLKKNYDYEMILVDDGSTDQTLAIIKSLCEKNEKIKGINLSQNFGQASAMLAGYSISTGEVVVHSDDDGQTPIDELHKLLKKLEEGYDMVFAQFDVKKNSFIQNIGTKINNLMASYLINKPKGLHMGNFWVCQSFVAKEAVKCKNPYPYLAGIFLQITKNIGAVPTSHNKRIKGKTNYTFKKMISLWLNGFTAFSIKPLRIASILGLLTSIAGFSYLIFIIVKRLQNPEFYTGYTLLAASFFFIGGMIMLLLGLIGEYIGRIYMNINNKPQYAIRDSFNLP